MGRGGFVLFQSGRGLAVTLMAVIVMLGAGFAVSMGGIAAPAFEQSIPAAREGPASLPGFRKRGNTVVGEVTGPDGTALRLVFEASSMRLIGHRIIEGRRGGATGCPEPAQAGHAPAPPL